ncbi:hypothetical protein PanWU01x14_099960, partial [Parasponia andersonii]
MIFATKRIQRDWFGVERTPESSPVTKSPNGPYSSSPSMAAAPTAGDRLVVAWGRLTDDLLGQTELGRWCGVLWPRERERQGRERERERS